MSDEEARNTLIEDFVARRQAMGIGARPLAEALQVRRNSVRTLERRRPFDARVSTLTAYGEPLGLKLVLDLTGVEVQRPPAAEALHACGYIGSALLLALIEHRRASGLIRRHLAEAAGGWSATAVADVERHDREPYLSTLQRYARGLGGRLEARWEEL